ncbi:4Fe-4S ferredoxin [Berryella intestinalis]|uniref:4Fe-4S ferredoxin n=2 Tax=Berryella intestinalis TaxID=1531429 RepID=A0A0A8B226_9ACTN|nr:4Fe-4S ferredoxin [Berryella intestinalis]
MADPDVCIGCRTCMAACLSKHDVLDDIAVARLNLVSTMKISAPIVCQHCADAPCAQVCPTRALYRDGGRIAVNEAACIGCRGCVAACPYGAVNVVTRTVTTKLGDLVIEQHEKPTVIKCDLCADRPEGPACIAACPTKGLVLVDKVELARRQIKAEKQAS